MKAVPTIKRHLFLFLFLLPFYLNAQLIHNIGVGSGFYKGEPKIISLGEAGEKFVGSRDFQFINVSYEPRLSLADSIFNQVSISVGMPVVLGFSMYEYLETTEVLGYGSAQAALIAYLNFGNGSSYKNMYDKKWGFSLGFGFNYLHSGIFERDVELVHQPKNDLIKPVMSYSIRLKTKRDVIMELNGMWRFNKSYYIEECEEVEPFGYWYCTDDEYKESGFLLQLKFFFGQ